MNKWNTLLKVLDAAYGAPDTIQSRFKVLKQAYDNDKQEHVVNLEYRYRRGDVPANKEIRKRKKDDKAAYNVRKQQTYKLLQAINNNTNAQIS